MLLATVLLPSTAVVFGIVLALWHLRPVETRRNPQWQIGILHGALGIGGLAALILLLQGPRRGDAMGVGSFGTAAAWLFAAAIAAGLTIPFLIRRFRTGAGVAIAVHASLAIIGYVLLLAWTSMGF